MIEAIESLIGVRPTRLAALGGGCVANVQRADLPDGSRVVVKADPSGESGLSVEASMLRYLAEHSRLPVPRVIAADDDRLLILEYIEHSGASRRAEVHAAELLADLHSITADAFGFETDTRIGGLRQPNGWRSSWPEFFGRERIIFMAEQAQAAGGLSTKAVERVRALGARLDRLLPHAARPSLIHGDVWAGNVLADGDRIAAFIDPAIYYADAEVELAFIALFSCFGEAFWKRYHELRPIDAEFFRTRRDLYNLYPLLVHTRLFGGGYSAQVEAMLGRFGV